MREAMLTLHFLGLAMGVGAGFAHMFLGMSMKDMTPEEAKNFIFKTMNLSKMGMIGLFVLLLTGGYLMTPYWESLFAMPYLVAKLSGVTILSIMLFTMNALGRRAVKTDSGAPLLKIKMMGKITLPLSLIIVILAVITFK